MWQIRLQLETLLAEKARLAHDNSVYARENRFLREIVEYHQLTMQDVVYLDEGSEEVTEVYPFTRMLSVSPPSSSSPSETTLRSLFEKEIHPVPDLPPETQEVSESDAPPSAGAPALKEVEEDAGRDAPPSAGMPVRKEKEEAKHIPANKQADEKSTPKSPIHKEEKEKTSSSVSPGVNK
jgi:hypothetical protein